MKKIIITGDVLRPCPVSLRSNQTENIMWFAHTIRYPLDLILTDTCIDVLVWGKGVNDFRTDEFYRMNELKISADSWAKLYDADLSESANAYMHEVFENTVVVGFELPNTFKNFFEKHKITFIDFSVDPVRFMDDLLFGILSNIDDTKSRVSKYTMHKDLFYINAGVHLAMLSRVQKLPLEQNSCLLIGQTEIDKVLIKNGNYVSLLDYSEEITTLQDKYRKIYFKPHPYATNKKKIIEKLYSYGIKTIEENVYYLLGHTEIKHVAGICSSVLHEAKYFMKSSQYFKSDHQYDYLTIDHCILNPSFWHDLLDSILETKEYHGPLLPFKPNRFRNSIGRYWGYDYLEFQTILKECIPINTQRISFVERLKLLSHSLKDIPSVIYRKIMH